MPVECELWSEFSAVMFAIDPVSVLLSVVLVLLLINIYSDWKRSLYKKFPPGPKKFPLIGNMHILLTSKLRPHQTFQKLSKKYGPIFSMQMGFKKVVVLCGYDVVKDALVNHGDVFSERPIIPAIEETTKGRGIIFAHGENWKVMRRFTLSALRDFGVGKKIIENTIIEECDALVDVFKSYNGQPFEDTSLMHAAVANVIVSILHGHRFDYNDPTFEKLIWMVNANIRFFASPMVVLSEKYGSVFTIHLGSETIVVLCGYETVKDALVNHAETFAARPKIKLFEEISNGHGIVFSSGENWKVMRKFTLSTLRDFGMGTKKIENKIYEECDSLIEKFCSFNGKSFDNKSIITAAATNIIVSILLNKRFEYEDPTFLRLLHLMDEKKRHLGSWMSLLYNAFPSLLRWFPGSHKAIFKNVAELENFIREAFRFQRDRLDTNDQRSLIDAFLVKQQEEKPSPEIYFHDRNLTKLVTDLLFAGMETVAVTLQWGLLLMMKYPEIQKKLQNEIEEVVGSAQPQTKHRKEMPYTYAVIHEIQRFADIAPSNIPHATTQDVTLKGHFIPKGTHVLPLLTSVLKDKAHFENPDYFFPEHFLDSEGNFVKKEAFIPFSAGRRSCAGENLAKMELFLFFTRLLQKFTFQPPPGAELDLTHEDGIATSPKPYHLCAIPRN
ncbi:cytochrome P450 2K1-like [Pelobates fuscus]|uniref:cytochrome P450 2K1-like n=1 Tax=Pelobates fuscus TaxID=191477 RepID=UPI002FE47820